MGGAKVFVYRDPLRHIFRLRDLVTTETEDCAEVWLRDATFHVSQAGRLKALRDGRRNVHAGVSGTRLVHPPRAVRCDVLVRYNPQAGPYFMTAGREAIHQAEVAHLINGAVYVPQEVRWL